MKDIIMMSILPMLMLGLILVVAFADTSDREILTNQELETCQAKLQVYQQINNELIQRIE